MTFALANAGAELMHGSSVDLAASCAAVLVASLLGSVHCAGMCGGLSACATPVGFAGPKPVALTSSVGAGPGSGADGRRRVGPSLTSMQGAYHGARLAGYALLGAVAGTVGAALDLGGSMVGVQRVASILAGATIAILGAVMLLRVAGVRIPHPPVPSGLSRLFGAVHRRAMRWPPVLRAASIGGITPLLPCGWLYAFVAIATGAGSALGGASVMAAFWVGTVPALVTVALGVRLAFRAGSSRLGRAMPALAAMLMVAVGVHLAFVRGGKAAVVASSVHPIASAGEESSSGSSAHTIEEAIDKIDDELPACCRGEAES